MNRSSLCEAIKRDIPITEYAENRGYTVMKAGRWFTLKEMDSIRIDSTDRIFYRNSNGSCGSIIDFVMETEQCSEEYAIIMLRRVLPNYHKRYSYFFSNNPNRECPQKTFSLPQKTDKSYKQLYAYLIKTRGIDITVVDDLVKRKQLYQDQRQNAVFVGYDKDGRTAYAALRSTNSNITFKGEPAGSQKNISMLVDNGSSTLVVCESPIDCMSIMTFIVMADRDYHIYDYLSLGGISYKSLFYHNSYKKYTTFLLCTDNDEAGEQARKEIRQSLIHKGYSNRQIIDKIPKSKDFNDDLLQCKNMSK